MRQDFTDMAGRGLRGGAGNGRAGRAGRCAHAEARGIHERVMTLDTHDDISPANFTAECNYTMDLGNQVNLPKMIKGGLDASFFIVYVGQSTADDAFTPAGYDRAYKSAIEKFDAIHRLTETDRAGQDRPGAHVGGRAADLQVGPQGRVHRRRERLPDRRGHQARQGVPRSRRALHVARAQRPQPAVGLQHRRGAGLEVERPVAARQAGDRGDEPRRHHDRRVASVEGIDDADAGADEGADHRVALLGPQARQPQPQPRRRAAARAEEERRRDADRGVQQLREDRAGDSPERAAALAALRKEFGLPDGHAARRRRRARRRAAAADAGASRARRQRHRRRTRGMPRPTPSARPVRRADAAATRRRRRTRQRARRR